MFPNWVANDQHITENVRNTIRRQGNLSPFFLWPDNTCLLHNCVFLVTMQLCVFSHYATVTTQSLHNYTYYVATHSSGFRWWAFLNTNNCRPSILLITFDNLTCGVKLWNEKICD